MISLEIRPVTLNAMALYFDQKIPIFQVFFSFLLGDSFIWMSTHYYYYYYSLIDYTTHIVKTNICENCKKMFICCEAIQFFTYTILLWAQPKILQIKELHFVSDKPLFMSTCYQILIANGFCFIPFMLLNIDELVWYISKIVLFDLHFHLLQSSTLQREY